MLLERFGLYGQKRSKPDVEQYFGELDAAVFELGDKPIGKVQSRGRRGGRAVLTRVHRLIPVLILELAVDIVRQRHFAYAVEYLLEYAVILELDCPRAVVALRRYYAFELGRKAQRRTDARALCGTAKRFPSVRRNALMQQEGYARARAVLDARYARRQYARIVDDEQIAFLEQVRQVVKMLMLCYARRARIYQKPRRVARLYGTLSDKLFGQIVVKIAFIHVRRLLENRAVRRACPALYRGDRMRL